MVYLTINISKIQFVLQVLVFSLKYCTYSKKTVSFEMFRLKSFKSIFPYLFDLRPFIDPILFLFFTKNFYFEKVSKINVIIVDAMVNSISQTEQTLRRAFKSLSSTAFAIKIFYFLTKNDNLIE